MKKLVLIDGNAILHRAYHALPPLTNSKGEPTNAVHGFFSMVLSVIDLQNPDFLIVCFDRAKPTFRQTLFVGYQQNRPKLSEDFVPQIIMVHKILEKVKIPVFEIDGFEADDLIGTIANQTSKNSTGSKDQKIETIIVSGDRDLLQLVKPNVKVLMPIIGISKSVLMREKDVEEKYGVKPSQFVDYKALVGDASDGYPGVAGIGPKTASDLVKKYKSFENIYKNLKKIPEKLALKLATDAEQAALAKKLATIDVNSPVRLDIKKCTVPGLKDFGKVLSDFGLKTLSARAYKFAEPGVQTADIVDTKVDLKDNSEQLDLVS